MNVLDLAIEYGLHPVRVSGTHDGEMACACPACGGSDRFRIWPGQNNGNGSYWCRQCGIHGDRIQFVRDTRNVGFVEAARITGDDGKITASGPRRSKFMQEPQMPGMPSHERKEYPPPKGLFDVPSVLDRAVWAEKVWKMVTWASGRLGGSQGERILAAKGITAASAQKHHLGYLAEDFYRVRASWGLADVLNALGKPKKLWIPAGITIPNTVSGAVNRVRVRRNEGEPRYYVVPGSTMSLFSAGNMADIIIIVESELDAILIDQEVGDTTGVIALGSASAKPDMGAARLLNSAKRLLIALDADPAGESASKYWLDAFHHAVRWPVPAGKDPSDAFQRGVNIRNWVLGGWPKGLKMVLTQHAALEKQAQKPVQEAGKQPFCSSNGARSDLKTASPSEEIEKMTGIDKVLAILRRNPGIKIIMTPAQMKLDAPAQWRVRNSRYFNMLSDLIFFDRDVFEYLHLHGATAIHAGNFLKKGGETCRI